MIALVESRRAKGFGTLGAREQVSPWTFAQSCPNRRSLIMNAQVRTTRSDNFKYTLACYKSFFSLAQFINIHLSFSPYSFFFSSHSFAMLQCGMYVAGVCTSVKNLVVVTWSLVKSVHCQSDSFDTMSRISRIHISSRSYRGGSAKRLARDAVSLLSLRKLH